MVPIGDAECTTMCRSTRIGIPVAALNHHSEVTVPDWVPDNVPVCCCSTVSTGTPPTERVRGPTTRPVVYDTPGPVAVLRSGQAQLVTIPGFGSRAMTRVCSGQVTVARLVT